MGLFEKKEEEAQPKPVKKIPLVQKLAKEIEASTTKWLKDHFNPKNYRSGFEQSMVDRYVDQALTEHIDQAILKKLGLENRWQEVEVRWDSPLRRTIEEAAQTKADLLVKRYVKKEEAQINRALPEKVRKAIDKRYEEAFLQAALKRAEELGEQRAREVADDLLKKKTGLGKILIEDTEDGG